ncbi:MAG: C69 family dipeptidase [Acidobacteriota bacterium]|nr:C69 family dipeptidase [Acidobacteriota bacterium]
MNKPTKAIPILILAVLAAALLASAAGPADGECYTVLVGKKASSDGSVMLAHNEDDRGDILVNLRKIPGRDYGSPQRVDLGKGAFFSTDGRTNGFLWLEATTQEFADGFINEHGVVIVSDSCPSRITGGELTDGGIGYMLRRLLAEKATSAREAVRIAGGLIEAFGYRASGRTYSIADKKEAWMLAVLNGRHWCAQRVPDDEIAIIPNHFTIRKVRLDDPDHFMSSPGLIEYAAKNGWYDKAKDGPFDFKKAFERPAAADLTRDGNTLRHWRGLNLLTGTAWEIGPDYPFSAKPGQKNTPEARRAVLRDHYEGTAYDATDGYKTGSPNKTKYRTICTASTIHSLIVSLDDKRPEPLEVRIWLALGKPDTTIYLPLYYGAEKWPAAAGTGALGHDYALFYKQHFEDAPLKAAKDGLLRTKVLALENAAEADYGPMRETLQRGLGPAEKEFLAGRAKFEKEFAALYVKDRKAAMSMLDNYIAWVFVMAEGLTEKLLGKPQGV